MITLNFDHKEDSLSYELDIAIDECFKAPILLEDCGSIKLQDVDDHPLQHRLIKGDNLLALYHLLEDYEGKVGFIYIDPPYNTGKTFFGYKDSMPHEEWLVFMKNRLEPAQRLLSKSGTIFISIGIHEMAYLKVLCDEIFGRKNFVGEIIWETASDNNATQITNQHEYVLCYAKEKANLSKWKIKSEKAEIINRQYHLLKYEYGDDTVKIQEELRKWIRNVKKTNDIDLSGVAHYDYVDAKGVFYPGNSANTRPGGYDFDIIHPSTKKICNRPENGYRWPEKTFWAADAIGDVLWPNTEDGIPKIKKRIDTATELLKGYFYEDNRKATKALTAMLGTKKFHNPKSLNLLKKIIRFASKSDDMVLDFFGGSGSTGHAVMEINQEDGSRRNFIMVEKLDFLDEVIIPRLKQVMSHQDCIEYHKIVKSD